MSNESESIFDERLQEFLDNFIVELKKYTGYVCMSWEIQSDVVELVFQFYEPINGQVRWLCGLLHFSMEFLVQEVLRDSELGSQLIDAYIESYFNDLKAIKSGEYNPWGDDEAEEVDNE